MIQETKVKDQKFTPIIIKLDGKVNKKDVIEYHILRIA